MVAAKILVVCLVSLFVAPSLGTLLAWPLRALVEFLAERSKQMSAGLANLAVNAVEGFLMASIVVLANWLLGASGSSRFLPIAILVLGNLRNDLQRLAAVSENRTRPSDELRAKWYDRRNGELFGHLGGLAFGTWTLMM